jgi:two-component SAPR family response regulator
MSGADDTRGPLQGVRVLLLEDDPLIRLDLEVSLSELGASVMAASSVASALKLLAVPELDFAVLDFELGAETSEQVAAAAKDLNIPFVFLSGYSKHDGRFSEWPDVEVLVKPISAEAIARHIRDHLDRQSHGMVPECSPLH